MSELLSKNNYEIVFGASKKFIIEVVTQQLEYIMQHSFHMKAYQVEYFLEQYIPEYQTYLSTQCFTSTEVSKITTRREKLERQIQETFAPQLISFAEYLEHLNSTAILAAQRYRQQSNQSDLPEEFRIPQKNYSRLYKLCMDSNQNNLKSWLFLINFAAEHKLERLLDTTTAKFSSIHSHMSIAWILRAKCIEQQSSVVDARIIYNQACEALRQYVPQQDVDHVTQILNADEICTEALPKDAIKLYLNWVAMELQYLQQILKGVDISAITNETREIAEGSFLELAIFKGLGMIIKCDVKGSIPSLQILKEIINSNQFINQLFDEIKALFSTFNDGRANFFINRAASKFEKEFQNYSIGTAFWTKCIKQQQNDIQYDDILGE